MFSSFFRVLHAVLARLRLLPVFTFLAVMAVTPVEQSSLPSMEQGLIALATEEREPTFVLSSTQEQRTTESISPVLYDFTVEVVRTYPFVWPASGPITSHMSSEHPLGIDIGLGHVTGVAPITATAGGVVLFAGGHVCCEYGLYVVVDHGGGLSTLYGHLSRIGVGVGQTVEQGELLGLGGTTGKSDGMHLHFEVRQDQGLVDPLRLLSANLNATETDSMSCATSALVLDRGSRVALTFASESRPGLIATQAELQPTGSTASALSVKTVLGATVVLESSPVISRNAESDYLLKLALKGAEDEQPVEVDCEIKLRSRAIPPSYFAPRRLTVPTPTPEPGPDEPALGALPLRELLHVNEPLVLTEDGRIIVNDPLLALSEVLLMPNEGIAMRTDPAPEPDEDEAEVIQTLQPFGGGQVLEPTPVPTAPAALVPTPTQVPYEEPPTMPVVVTPTPIPVVPVPSSTPTPTPVPPTPTSTVAPPTPTATPIPATATPTTAPASTVTTGSGPSSSKP